MKTLSMVNAADDQSSLISFHLSHPPDINALAEDTHIIVFGLQAHHSSLIRLVRHLLSASGRVPTQSCRHLELIDSCLSSCGIYLGLLSVISSTLPLSFTQRAMICYKLEQWAAVVQWCDAMTSLLECWGCGSVKICNVHHWKEALRKESQIALLRSSTASPVQRTDGKIHWYEVQN
jgi:hypothetical protein